MKIDIQLDFKLLHDISSELMFLEMEGAITDSIFRVFSKRLANPLHIPVSIEELVLNCPHELDDQCEMLRMIDRMAGHIWEAWRKEKHDDAKERRRNLTISFFLSLSGTSRLSEM